MPLTKMLKETIVVTNLLNFYIYHLLNDLPLIIWVLSISLTDLIIEIVRWPKGATQGSTIMGGNSKRDKENEVNNPNSLSFDLDGNLYIADTGNNLIQRFYIIRNASFFKIKLIR